VTSAADVTASRRGQPDRAEPTGSSASGPASRLAFRLFVASVIVAAVPVVVATVRAIGRHWIPIGDDGNFAIRSFDVFGHNIPLLGTWSSSSLSYGTNLNNPGPLLFDVLAVPVRLFGGNVGLPVGVALVNIAALIGIAVFAYRRGGPLVGTLAMTVGTALCWAMGSELLYDPWQPHSLVLPFLFFVVLVWSFACGDLLALPVGVFVGSLVLETHLTYTVLVPVLSVFGLIGFLVELRRDRRRDPDRWPGLRRRTLRVSALAAVVLLAAWTQTLIEQVTRSGNLTRLVRSARNAHVHPVGYGLGARLAASVLALPPWWFRPSVQHTFYVNWQPPSLGVAMASLVALVAALTWCGWDARRRHDRVAALAVVTAAVASIAAVITVAQSPITVFGVYTPHTLRSLWPLAAFVFFAIAMSVARRLAILRVPTDALVGAFLVLAVVLGAINLPYANLGDGPNSQQWAIPAQRQLEQHFTSLEGHGPLLIDDLFRTFADPHGSAVLAELQQRGVSFVAQDAALVAQIGPGRRFDGTNAKLALLLRTGDAALTTPSGSRRVGLGEGLSPASRRQLLALHAQLATYLHQHGVKLNHHGTTDLARRELPSVRALGSDLGPGLDPEPLFTSRDLVTMARHQDLVLDNTWAHRLQQYAGLQRQWDRATVALFLAPVDTVAKHQS
jgi:hypothetical protein